MIVFCLQIADQKLSAQTVRINKVKLSVKQLMKSKSDLLACYLELLSNIILSRSELVSRTINSIPVL